MKNFIAIILFAIAGSAFGQFNLSFYQMGNAAPQNMNYNAAAFPKSRMFVSLPGLAGVDLSVNNSFGMTDVLTTTGDSTLLDINKFLSNQKEGAFFNTTMVIPELMIGFRTGENGFVTLFANERIDATIFYPMKLLNFVWNGNYDYVGKDYLVDDISFDQTVYREYGVGYGRNFEILGRKTTIGVRAKYLVGMAHTSVQKNLEMKIRTNDDYSVKISMNDGLVRMAGLNKIENYEDEFQYFINNQNTGFGLDLAANMDLTDRINVGIAANDLGFIKWKEDSEETQFKGASFSINGSSFDNMDKLADAMLDSIENLDVDTVAATFSTTLNSKVYLSGSYRLTKSGYAQVTMANYFTQGRMKSSIGLGYLQDVRNWLSVSLTGSIVPQAGADIGAGLMLRGGPLQFYFNMDQILNTIDIPQAKGMNVKFGFNFLIGKPVKKVKKSKKDESAD